MTRLEHDLDHSFAILEATLFPQLPSLTTATMHKGSKVRYKRPLNDKDAARVFTLVETPTHPTVYIQDENFVNELVSIDEIEVVT